MKTETPSLANTASEMLISGHADKFRLMNLCNVPGSTEHPLRFSAMIATISNKQFQAVGNSPVDAVANAIGQEMIARQGWSHGG